MTAILTVTVGGTALPVYADTVNVVDRIGERSTAMFAVRDDAKTMDMPYGTRVVINDGTNDVFTGYVWQAKKRRVAYGAGWRWDVMAMDEHYVADKRLIADGYSGQLAGDIVKDIIDGHLGGPGILAAEGVTYGTIESGEYIAQASYNYVTCTRALDTLAEASDFVWYIDTAKALHFRSRSSVAAPWTVTPADTQGEPDFTEDGADLRTRQWVRGGTALTDEVTDEVYGDGLNRAFALSWPVGTAPVVDIDTGGGWTSQTVGIAGVDTGKQWWWNKGRDIITHDAAQTVLGATDKVRVTYQGQYDIVGIVEDTPGVTTQAAVDGTSGVIENVDTVADVDSSTAVFNAASQRLVAYGDPGITCTFATRRSGLRAGQLVTVQATDLGWDDTFLITSVEMYDVGGLWFVWQVEAVRGPVQSGSWAKWLGARLTRAGRHVIRENVSEQQVVVVVAGPYPEAWEWSESVTPTINACPIPSATLYPSPTLYPC